jgi:hypothetical protein
VKDKVDGRNALSEQDIKCSLSVRNLVTRLTTALFYIGFGLGISQRPLLQATKSPRPPQLLSGFVVVDDDDGANFNIFLGSNRLVRPFFTF